MSLSCVCDDDYDWYFEAVEPVDFIPMPTLEKGCKCSSCRKSLMPGSDVVKFKCWEEDEELNEIPRPDEYLCEECGGLYMAVADLKLCVTLGTDLREDVKEWAEAQAYYRQREYERKNP